MRQVVRLGYESTEVENIVLTHIDLDDAGTISDFRCVTVDLVQLGRAVRCTDLARLRGLRSAYDYRFCARDPVELARHGGSRDARAS